MNSVFNKLLDFFPIPAVIFDPKLTYIKGNLALLEFLSVPEDELRHILINSDYTDVSGVIPVTFKDPLLTMISRGQLISNSSVIISSLEESHGVLKCCGYPLFQENENLGGILFLYPGGDRGSTMGVHQINNHMTVISGQLAVMKMVIKERGDAKGVLEQSLATITGELEKISQELASLRKIL